MRHLGEFPPGADNNMDSINPIQLANLVVSTLGILAWCSLLKYSNLRLYAVAPLLLYLHVAAFYLFLIFSGQPPEFHVIWSSGIRLQATLTVTLGGVVMYSENKMRANARKRAKQDAGLG